jgi:hypothetical protein
LLANDGWALVSCESQPAAFALPAGAGDVAVGLLAPIVAVAYARGVAGREFLVVCWKLLGLLDLANAITTRIPDVAVAAAGAVARCTEPANQRVSAGVSASVSACRSPSSCT